MQLTLAHRWQLERHMAEAVDGRLEATRLAFTPALTTCPPTSPPPSPEKIIKQEPRFMVDKLGRGRKLGPRVTLPEAFA